MSPHFIKKYSLYNHKTSWRSTNIYK